MSFADRARRIGLAALLASALAAPALAFDRLTIIAPAAPGGGWDSTARSMQDVLQTTGIAKSVQVENVAGAGGTVGLAQFVRKKGDGNALMATGLVMAGAILTNKSPVTLADVTPIARLTAEWQSIAVPVNSDIKSVKDLVDRLKANPGAVSWGGGSAGGADHMTAGLFARAVGVDPSKVNYVAHSGGGESLASILGGHVTIGINSASEFAELVKAGKLRFVAVSSPERLRDIDAPTFKELGIDLVFSNWRGVLAPPGLSDAERKALAEAIDKMVKSPQWKAALDKRGWLDAYMPQAEFEAFLKEERGRVEATLRAVGLVK